MSDQHYHVKDRPMEPRHIVLAHQLDVQPWPAWMAGTAVEAALADSLLVATPGLWMLQDYAGAHSIQTDDAFQQHYEPVP